MHWGDELATYPSGFTPTPEYEKSGDVILPVTFGAVVLLVWALVLSRHAWAPRTKLYWVAAIIVGALMLGWALALAGLGWSAWSAATHREGTLSNAVTPGLVAASVGAGELFVVCTISFVLLAKWTWDLNQQIGRSPLG